MAVIWGLDLKEMQWGKFKGSYMFNQVYHLRKTKMIVYQIAMIFMVCSESVGTAALSDYVDQQDGIQTRYGLHTENNDIVGIFAYNIFVGIAVATIFGSGFFFDLFWPERHESHQVKLAWKICSVIMCLLTLADAIGLTVIVATGRATIDGLSNSEAQRYFNLNGIPAPVYRKNAYCVASTVLCWIGMVGTYASTYIMWKSLAHNDAHGPMAAAYRNKGEEASVESRTSPNDVLPAAPEPVHTHAPAQTTTGHPVEPAPEMSQRTV
ncbi:gpi ethanolamine phosphate transferase 2 protein [Rutstroemia sp. NJR-2017a WRK4]|nr:gpi ethanolamine phosphate transferase 2 protein [Rutstroemia sp. NJR-2017a WRK4]